MLDALFIYRRYIGVSLRGQMQYRAAFIMQTLGHLLATGVDFLGMWALFTRFGQIKGWTLPQASLFYGMINVAFSLADAGARGFDVFDQFIKTGSFDRLLLRPRSTVLQLLGHELTLKRVGRLAQGLAVLIWALCALDVAWSPAKALLLLAAIAGAACLFFGLVMLQATMAFWTIESLEIMNTVTYGGVETAQYPLAIYHPWFRRFFTFIVPLACVCYYPALAIMDKPCPTGAPTWLGWFSPVAGLAFLVVALQVWKVGVRHYRSTGS
jgi:ABC-2 type transport system permease protein